MNRSRTRAADMLLLAKVGGAAIAGGLFAMAVLYWENQLPEPGLIFAVIVADVVFCVLAVATLLSSSDPEREHTRQNPARNPRPIDHVRPGPFRDASPPSSAFLPPEPSPPVAPPSPPIHAWYAEAARETAIREASPVAVQAGFQKPPEPEGNGVVPRFEEHPVHGSSSAVRRIAQCPRCADFDLKVSEEAAGFAFACGACRYRWLWEAGTPWPPTVTQPALRISRRPGPV